MFGLAVVAAIAAMAFVGASSAMAENTAICDEDPAGGALACPSGHLVQHVHYVASGAKLLNALHEVVCDALFLGDVLSPFLGAPLHIEGNFTYSNCSTGCEAKQVSSTILIEVLKTAPELANVTGKGEVLVNCVSIIGKTLIHCIYNGKNLTGHALGGLTTTAAEKGHVTFTNAVVEKVSGILCPNTAELDALFESLNKEYLKS
jgi:hypothetical protein